MIYSYSLSYIHFFIFSISVLVILLLLALAFELYKFFLHPNYLNEKQTALIYKRSLSILDKARSQALNIISSAHVDSNKIIQEIDTLDNLSKNRIKQDLHKISEKHNLDLSNLVENLNKEYKNLVTKESGILDNYVDNMQNSVKADMSELKDVLLSEIKKTQEELSIERTRKLSELDAEFAQYQATRKQEYSELIEKNLDKLLAEVISLSMTKGEKQQLILKCLDNLTAAYAQNTKA